MCDSSAALMWCLSVSTIKSTVVQGQWIAYVQKKKKKENNISCEPHILVSICWLQVRNTASD